MFGWVFGKKKTNGQEDEISASEYGRQIDREMLIYEEHSASHICEVEGFLSCFGTAARGTAVFDAGQKTSKRIEDIKWGRKRSDLTRYMPYIHFDDLTVESRALLDEKYTEIIKDARLAGNKGFIPYQLDIFSVAPLRLLMEVTDEVYGLKSMNKRSIKDGQGEVALAFWRAVNAQDSYGSFKRDDKLKEPTVHYNFPPVLD